jgi:hypothetical protein
VTAAAKPSLETPLDDPLALLPWVARLSCASRVVDTVAVGTVETRRDGSIRVSGQGRSFEASAVWMPLAAIRGWSVELRVQLRPDSTPVDAAIDVALRVPADREPAWLVPGLFYGDNRPAASTARYPRWVPDADDATDGFTAADWWFRSDRAATPAILATGGGTRVALATTETSDVGETGVGFGTVETEDGPRREIRLSFPYREAPVVYDGSATPLPPDEPTWRWSPGQEASLRFWVYLSPATADASADIMRDLHGRLAPTPPLRAPIDASETAGLAADGLIRWHWRPSDDVLIETAAFDRSGEPAGAEPGTVPGDRLAMHVGWLSGAPAAAALLRHGVRTGRDDAIAVGRGVLDVIAANLAPCGTFWGQWTSTSGWGKGWTPGPDAVHGRTLAEATLFMVRAIAAAGADASPSWRRAVTSNLAYVVAHEAGGAIPTDWNARTGEPLSWAGTSALAWVPALIEASQVLGDDAIAGRGPRGGPAGGPRAANALLDVAGRVGAHHVSAVKAGLLRGAPEDVDLGPTSEDGYVAIQAYVALARAAASAGERASCGRWLGLARSAADWTLTFRYTYDVAFPPDSLLGAVGFRTRGADMASPANQHLHSYGLICIGEMAELSRLTGDPSYLARARETFTCFRAGIARADGELGARRGMAPERFYQTRYDGPKGSVGPLSHAWCLGLLLHAAEVALGDPELADSELADREPAGDG